MLYLTMGDTGHKQVYRAYIVPYKQIVYLDNSHVWKNQPYIIDIDPVDACALVLKGFTLFKVSEVIKSDRPTYNYIAIMADTESFFDYYNTPTQLF